MNKFDRNIHDKLEGYSSQVNKDLWNKISANLPVQEQSTFKHWWLAMFSVVIVFIGVATYFWLSSNGNFKQDFDFNDNLVLNDENPSQGLINKTRIENVEYLNKESSVVVENPTLTTMPSKAINLSGDVTKKINYSTNHATSLDIVNKQKMTLEAFDQFPEELSNQNGLTANERVKVGLYSTDKSVGSLYKQYNTIINKAKNKEFSNDNQQERLSIEELNRLTIKFPELLTSSNFDNFSKRMNGKKLICPSFSNTRFGVFVEGYYSSDFGMRELSYNGPISEADYLNVRNQTESSSYSYSAGMRLSFLLPMGIGAKTGINYSQINETFKYVDPNSNKTQTVIIKEYIWENGVITDSSEMTKQVSIPGSLNVVSQNKYKVIDIPLLFTYEWGYKKRMYYSVTAGPMFNLKFTQKGKFLNPETLTPVDFTTSTGNYKAFNTNIGTSVYLGFALNYQLGHGTDIFIEPNMKHYLQKSTLNSYLLNQKYTVFGIGFGVKHKI